MGFSQLLWQCVINTTPSQRYDDIVFQAEKHPQFVHSVSFLSCSFFSALASRFVCCFLFFPFPLYIGISQQAYCGEKKLSALIFHLTLVYFTVRGLNFILRDDFFTSLLHLLKKIPQPW